MKREKQLLIEGLEGYMISKVNSSVAVTLKGTLVGDRGGNFPFSLKNAVIINDVEKKDNFWVFLGVILVLGVILGFIAVFKASH